MSVTSAREHLRDGSPVEVRALRPEDEADMLAALDQASPQSLQRRFFAMKRHFSDKERASSWTSILRINRLGCARGGSRPEGCGWRPPIYCLRARPGRDGFHGGRCMAGARRWLDANAAPRRHREGNGTEGIDGGSPAREHINEYRSPGSMLSMGFCPPPRPHQVSVAGTRAQPITPQARDKLTRGLS